MVVEPSFCPMASHLNFVCIFSLILMIKPLFSRQSYDKSDCTSEPQVPGSNYVCNPEKLPCKTYIVYRAQQNHQTLSAIASLFNSDVSQLLPINSMAESNHSSDLGPGHEIIIPITCSCPDRFSEVKLIYNASHSDTPPSVACRVFEGLAKAQILIEENPDFGGGSASTIRVPVRCACPGKFERSNGVKYLVTYPVIEGDRVDLMASKFGVPEEMILAVNELDRYAAIYPQTTLLIPTKGVPKVDVETDSLRGNPSPSPQGADPPRKDEHAGDKNSRLALGLGISMGIGLTAVASGVSVFSWRRHHRRLRPSSETSSQSSNLSRDFLDGMSKLKQSLVSFGLEELRSATEGFGEASMIGGGVYQGRIGGRVMAVKEMESDAAAHHVIDILTRMNHVNIVRLEGCCCYYAYGAKPYLGFQFVENGSLRDCLSSPKLARQLTWKRRVQIAFDIAVALHYIHYCTKPTYVHGNISSTSVLITTDWRVKISGFQKARPLLYDEEQRETHVDESVMTGREGYLAPEYLRNGVITSKMDIFAFGVVLMEIMSGKEAAVTKKKTQCVLGMEGRPSESTQNLKEYIDPLLHVDDYSMSDVHCLASLARYCTEDDYRQRPTINDLLKALSSIIT